MRITVAGIDLGASSGRVVAGHMAPNQLGLETVARFPNGPVRRPDGLHWDLPRLIADSLAGLRAAGPVAAIGVDSWAVDYGLTSHGKLLDLPWCYRDERTAAGVAAIHSHVPPAELYARTGLQFLPFNTIYQLAAETRLAHADQMLLIPDLVASTMTGVSVCERTNASTTGLLDISTGEWDRELLELVGLSPSQLPALVDPGTVTGTYQGTPVVAVGSHDTASAVVGIPLTEPDAAYISCGTWGLVGVELERPVLTEDARAANFTNEGGVDGRVRFLTNVMGTWLLSETLRSWGESDLAGLLARAQTYTGHAPSFDVQDPRFVAPSDDLSPMSARIERWFHEHGVEPPANHTGIVLSIVRSLARAFADAVRQASALSGNSVSRVHVVGGGAQNALLCRLLAARLEMPVLAGPVEATALGNVLIQGRALGVLPATLEDLRTLVAHTHPPITYLPGAPS